MQLSFLLKIFLLLGFFNFMGKGTYIICAACALFLILNKNIKIQIDGLLMCLCIWAINFVIFAHGMSGILRILLPVTGVLCFLAGQAVVKRETMYENLEKYYLTIAFATMAHGLINMFLNVRRYGWDFEGRRVMVDLWSAEDTSATGQATLFLLLSSVLYYIIVFAPKKPLIRYVVLVSAVILGIVYNIMTASRFILYVTIISLFFSVFVYIFHKRTKDKFKPLIIAIVAFSLVLVIYNANILGVRTWVESSALSERIDRMEAANVDSAFTSISREEEVEYVLSDLPTYFFGGAPTGLPFIHNTWLSVLNSGGLMLAIPFLLFTLLLLFIGTRQIFRCPQRYSLIVFGFLVGVFVYMYLEPMFEGAQMLFFAMAFISGMMSKIETIRKNGAILY